jgi:hypothetical protein
VINLERDQDVIKRIGINTKKEWVSIEEKVEKGVDKYPLISYI